MVKKGYKQTDEHRSKIAASKRKQYEDPAEREKQRQGSLARSHGHVGTGTYSSWGAMKQRCLNRNHRDYPRYGGRGITVCDRWLKFENFLADMGPRPEGYTIDRIDHNGNYEPGNCRWIPAEEQQKNRRQAGPENTRRKLTWEQVRWIRSRPMTRKQMAAELGVALSTVKLVLAGKTWKADGPGPATPDEGQGQGD